MGWMSNCCIVGIKTLNKVKMWHVFEKPTQNVLLMEICFLKSWNRSVSTWTLIRLSLPEFIILMSFVLRSLSWEQCGTRYTAVERFTLESNCNCIIISFDWDSQSKSRGFTQRVQLCATALENLDILWISKWSFPDLEKSWNKLKS